MKIIHKDNRAAGWADLLFFTELLTFIFIFCSKFIVESYFFTKNRKKAILKRQ